MRRFLILMMAVMLAGLSFTDDAEARRRGFSFGGSKTKMRSMPKMPMIIPIPGGGSSVVFVKELPDIPVFSFQDKGYYDLGYKFGSFGGGEWVGYFKAKSGYVELDQAKVMEVVLPLVGLTEADAPQRSAGAQMRVGLLWLVMAVSALGFLMLRSPALRRAIFAMRGRKDEDDEVKMPKYGLRSAPAGAPTEPRNEPRPRMAAVSRPASPSPAFGRAAPVGGFGKRR